MSHIPPGFGSELRTIENAIMRGRQERAEEIRKLQAQLETAKEEARQARSVEICKLQLALERTVQERDAALAKHRSDGDYQQAIEELEDERQQLIIEKLTMAKQIEQLKGKLSVEEWASNDYMYQANRLEAVIKAMSVKNVSLCHEVNRYQITNTRLNRRCQQSESTYQKKIFEKFGIEPHHQRTRIIATRLWHEALDLNEELRERCIRLQQCFLTPHEYHTMGDGRLVPITTEEDRKWMDSPEEHRSKLQLLNERVERRKASL